MPTVILSKMKTERKDQVDYKLKIENDFLSLNKLIGREIQLAFTGNIFCLNCKKKTSKSFSQGYCFSCSQQLASCDLCIVRPETCHYHLGTCREPSWGEENCLRPHYVYLANVSSLKVGITRESQKLTRFMDQGAIEALRIFKVKSRLLAGLVEGGLKEYVSDKTNWRYLINGKIEKEDLPYKRDELFEFIEPHIEEIYEKHGEDSVEFLMDSNLEEFQYPVLKFPQKIQSLNLEKCTSIKSELWGIKGQYLLFEYGAINVRKHSGFEVELSYE